MITGRTRTVFVISDPVFHLKSPQTFNARFAELGRDAVMVPVQVGATELRRVWDSFRLLGNLAGLTVAMPHKGSVAALCDQLGETARIAGTVNVVRREPNGTMIGENFDGQGFVEGLRGCGYDPVGQTVLIVGTGGGGSAVAFALAAAGAAEIRLANRNRQTADALARKLAAWRPSLRIRVGDVASTGCSLVVNATSLGMQADDPLPLDATRLSPGTLVADLVMDPEDTALLRAARSRGCAVQPGLPMLRNQIALMTEFLQV
jgi:shikimate dehydrogenase